MASSTSGINIANRGRRGTVVKGVENISINLLGNI